MEKDIRDITAAMRPGEPNLSLPKPAAQHEPQPIGDMAKLFLRFQHIFGHRWSSVIDSDEAENVALAEWGHQLAGLDGHDLQRGMNRLHEREERDRRWPPGAIEFRDLCRPSYADLGMPEPEDAYLSAIHRDWQHMAVHWAAQRCWHQLMFQSTREARPAFFRHYADALRLAQDGHVFEEPQWMQKERSLAHVKPEPLSADEQIERLAQMKKDLATRARGRLPAQDKTVHNQAHGGNKK